MKIRRNPAPGSNTLVPLFLKFRKIETTCEWLNFKYCLANSPIFSEMTYLLEMLNEVARNIYKSADIS